MPRSAASVRPVDRDAEVAVMATARDLGDLALALDIRLSPFEEAHTLRL